MRGKVAKRLRKKARESSIPTEFIAIRHKNGNMSMQAIGQLRTYRKLKKEYHEK